MDVTVTTMLVVVALIHSALYFIDQFLKSCMNVPYLYFLENTGFTIRPLQLQWFTSAFNRPITKWALWRPRFFRIWFSIGAVVVCLLLLPSILLLLMGLISYFHTGTAEAQSLQPLQPVIPGINLPMEELSYYFVTLLLASIIHEAGHAIAAVREDVHVNGFGFLFLFVLPGAYVDVPTDEIKNLSPTRQLKILCAGVWHNVVLVLVAVVIALSAPVILQPLYHHGEGVSVLGMTKDSPVRGPTGLQVSDVIISINKSPVLNLEDWRSCLVKSVTSDQIGFCVPEQVVHTYDETIHHAFEGADGSVQCCDGESDAHLCFELQENKDTDVGVAPMQPFSCLPARIALAMSSKTCLTSTECPMDTYCLAPSLHNVSRLLQVTRRGGSKSEIKDDVIYLGPPATLHHTLQLSNYVPKYSFIPLSWPNSLETYCDYMVKFSGALAVLNMVPVFYLDGYWIFGALIDLMFADRLPNITRRSLQMLISMMGTILLALNLILGIKSIL